MKKILIYTVNNGGFVDSLYHSLGEGFKKIGREVIYCDVEDANFESNIAGLINNKQDIDFSIGHNEFGIINTNQYDFLKDFYKVKEHVAILDDAPYNEITEKTFEVDCKRLLIAYRDRSNIDYLKSIALKNQPLDYFFLPFGAIIDKRMDLKTKDIDIIFSGMYYGEVSRMWYCREIDKSLQAFLDLAATILETEAVSVDEAISQVIKNCNIEIDKRELNILYRFLFSVCIL